MYTLGYKRKSQFFFRRIKRVVGHKHDEKQNKMIVYFLDGSVREIADWVNCEMLLGADWFVYIKKDMEQKAGQPIITNNG